MKAAISRREALVYFARTAAGVAACALFAPGLKAADPQSRPNILFIMSDDHAAHALSCYGSTINKTPNLDRLAREGMRFENCFVTNALCGPSRATLLTGKYSHMNGMRDNKAGTKFDGAQQTFPKLLQKAGYQTAVIGKWHLGSDPTGFDHWSILPNQGEYINPVFVENGQKQQVNGYVTDVITDKALAWMKNRDKNRPFCLLYHHKAPHRTWVPDEKHATLYEADIPEPATFNDDYAGRASAARDQKMSIASELNEKDLKGKPPEGLTPDALKKWKYQRFIKDYLRVVASLDDNVGRVLDWLEKEGLAENTIVVYTSDNGFFLGDHGWFDKRFMYEQSLRVPLLVRYPGRIKPGSVSKDIVSNLDFGPTFLDYAGAPIPADMQGRSMRPVLDGRTPADWRQVFYYHYYEFPQPHRVQPHYGIRTAKHKLIHYPQTKEWELFDLENDANELKNVYALPANAKIRESLAAQLEQARRQFKDNE